MEFTFPYLEDFSDSMPFRVKGGLLDRGGLKDRGGLTLSDIGCFRTVNCGRGAS